MLRTISTFFLALTAVFGLFANTGVAGVLRVESLLEAAVEGMGGLTSSQWQSFLEIPLTAPERHPLLSATDFSSSGMETTPSHAPSSVSPCCLSECVELPLVCLTTYLICESRATLDVPFLDGIFRPPKTA